MNPNDFDRFNRNEISICIGNPQGKIIEGTLYFKNTTTRNLKTKLPLKWFDNQISNTVVALTKMTVENLDEYHRIFLKNSLKYMSDSYNKGINPKEMKNMISLPNEAFINASFQN